MNISDTWSTLVSIILGLAIAEVLLNLHRLIDNRKRIHWDPLPLIWSAIVLLWLFNYWWAVATNLDGSQNARVVGDFVLLAIAPTLLFLMAASVLPRLPEADVAFDMRAHWAEKRSVFLALFALHQCAVWTSVAVVHHSIPLDFAGLLRTLALLLIVLLLFVRARRLEWFAALAILAMVTLRLSMQSAH